MEAEPNIRTKILTNKFTPLMLSILTIYIFFYAISNSFAEEYEIMLAIIGGIICLALSLWLVGSWLPKLFEKIPIITGIVCISTIFIFGYFFISKTSEFSSKELKENGVLTEATIIDKTKIYGRRGKTIQNISVSFLTETQLQKQATIDVTPKEFEGVQEGMIISIYYSSKHPNIARIAYSNN